MEVFCMNLGITMVYAGVCIWCMRWQGRARRITGVSCFFMIGCFLDRLCSLVMEGIVHGNSWGQMRFAGLVLSKSMAGILLFVACCMGRKSDKDQEETDDASGNRFEEDSAGTDPAYRRGTERDSGEQNGRGRDSTGKGHMHRSGTDREKRKGKAYGRRRMTYMEKLTVSGSVFFWCVLMASGAALGRGPGIGQSASPRQGKILAADFAWTGLLFAVLLAFYLSVYCHVRLERDRQAARNRQQERRQTEAYLYTIESHYQRTRELWHDLRNHISLLDLLLQEEKYGQMRDYLKVFGEEVDRIALPAKSGNLIVDAVLADKVARAKREKMDVKVELCDLTRLYLRPDEICSLFGNLLDNATEACRQVEGERKITVTCRTRGEETYLSVRNTMAEEKSGQGKLLVSRKKDRENVVGHGLGLRSVERVVNRYAGELVTDARGGIFTVAVRLPGEAPISCRESDRQAMSCQK